MAKQIITVLTDDLDGSNADETLTFALDGMGYEIDLNSKNAKKLRDFMEQFIEGGTRTGRVGSGAQITRHRSTPQSGSGHPNFTANRALNTNIRQWATANGYSINERGRIPQHIVDAYHQGLSNPSASEGLAAESTKTPAKNGRRSVPAASFKPEKVSA